MEFLIKKHVIEPSCPFDTRICTKEQEKLDNYNPLKFKVAKLWGQKKVTIVPIIIGALGTVSSKFQSWVNTIDIECPTKLLQKTCLLVIARIIRKVM